MASFPTSVKTFTTKSNGQTIQAAFFNEPQDEITAIEDGLLNGTAPISCSNVTSANIVRANNQPRANVFSSAVTALSSNSTTSISFDAELFDVGAMHSTATNPDRITIPTGSSGLYNIVAMTVVNTISTVCHLHVTKNSSRELSVQVQTGALGGHTGVVAGTLVCDASDILRFEVRALDSTLSVGSTAAGFASRLMVTRLW